MFLQVVPWEAINDTWKRVQQTVRLNKVSVPVEGRDGFASMHNNFGSDSADNCPTCP